jgi:hypothetical protein
VTYSATLSAALLQLASVFQVPYLCFHNCPTTRSPFAFRFLPSCAQIAESLNHVLSTLNWEYVLFYDDSECSNELFHALNSSADFYMPKGFTEMAELTMALSVKTSKFKTWVLVTGAEMSAVLQGILIDEGMMVEGTGLLAGPYSGNGLSSEGILLAMFGGQNTTASFENFIVSSIVNTSVAVAQAMSVNMASLEQAVSIVFPMHRPKTQMDLFNINKKSLVKVREYYCEDRKNYTSFKDIVYVGGVTTAPINTKTKIMVSLSAGLSKPPTSPQRSNQNMMNGAALAVTDFNANATDFDGFKFGYTNVTCYTKASSINTSCYDSYSDKFGLIHFSPHSEPYSIMLYDYLKDKKLSLFGSSDGLEMADKNNYPMYISTGIPYKYDVNALLQVITFMGFDSIAVASDNSSNSIEWYSWAVADAQNYNLAILNNVSKSIFKVDSSGNLIDADSTFQDIVNSKARIVIISCSMPTFLQILSKFVDLGLETGDIFCALKSLNISILANTSDPTFEKRSGLINGHFSLSSISYYGDLGQNIAKRLLNLYGTYSVRTCDYYDAFMLAAHAIQSLIITGKRYDNSTRILSEARKTRFRGCHGLVKMIDSTNMRSSESYTVQQVIMVNNSYTFPIVANYYPTGTTLFEVVQPISWGTTESPTSIRVHNWNCPFNPNHLSFFKDGIIIISVVTGVISIFTIITTIYIWKRFWHKEIEMMTKSEELSFQDSVTFITVFLEFFQLAAMGPSVSPFFGALSTFSSASSFSIENIISLKNGVFWYVLLSMLFSSGYWVLLCIVWAFNLHERFYSVLIFRFFGWSILNLMPILGNLMFIPIISTLINVFQCDQSLDGTIAQSVLYQDCYQTCWTQHHIAYAVVSGIFILIYQPLAVFLRPVWQDYLPLLHVKALPSYLTFKSAFQVLLIVLNKTLKRYYAFAHGIVFLCLIIIYEAILLTFKAYNYERVNLWQKIGIATVIWLAFTTVLYDSGVGEGYILLPLLFIGWVLMILIGLWIQIKKYPSLLYRKPQKDLQRIIRWMFNIEKGMDMFSSARYEDQSAEPKSDSRMLGFK